MRQQEYNEMQDIKRDLALFVVALVAFMSLMVITADAAQECTSWEWRQTGSHPECSGWYCWNVPEYEFVCTAYASEPEPIPIMPIGVVVLKENIQEIKEDKATSLGFSYTFGHNDTERYQIQKEINNTRAIYIMENIAWSYGFSPREFETKYKIR